MKTHTPGPWLAIPTTAISYDAAFAAAGLANRVEGASVNTMTRISLAALTVAELEAENAIPEGCYDDLLDLVGKRLSDSRWPAPGIRISAAVRAVLVIMKGVSR
jgi:hypothetical protein